MNIEDLEAAMRDAYADFYENPRGIHYFDVAEQYDTDELVEVDMIAAVIDLAVEDAVEGRGRRDIDSVLRRLWPEEAER